MSEEEYNKLKDKVYNFKTKHKIGFVKEETEALLKDYPQVNMDRFQESTDGNSVQVIDDKIVEYHCDILLALVCGLENRGPNIDEWD
tara:strand:- start:7742 stop:8002 length:261 start_codon:yes stop_codon:yes gene_type:complete